MPIWGLVTACETVQRLGGGGTVRAGASAPRVLIQHTGVPISTRGRLRCRRCGSGWPVRRVFRDLTDDALRSGLRFEGSSPSLYDFIAPSKFP